VNVWIHVFLTPFRSTPKVGAPSNHSMDPRASLDNKRLQTFLNQPGLEPRHLSHPEYRRIAMLHIRTCDEYRGRHSSMYEHNFKLKSVGKERQ
jgi:hypothetical protein